MNKYKPEVIWSDGDWDALDTYWNSTEFIAWLYNESPVKDTVVVNDRWGSGVMCRHGDFYTCQDNYNPGQLVDHKWENCMPLDTNSWGFRRNMKLSDVLTIEMVIKSLIETVSCGGNILINIGPTKEGHIPAIFEERLRQLGSWLDINGEGIYESKPWRYQNDTTNPDVWYTSNDNVVYAFFLKYPFDSCKIQLSAPEITAATEITLLGYPGKLQWVSAPQGGYKIFLFQILKSIYRKKTFLKESLLICQILTLIHCQHVGLGLLSLTIYNSKIDPILKKKNSKYSLHKQIDKQIV